MEGGEEREKLLVIGYWLLGEEGEECLVRGAWCLVEDGDEEAGEEILNVEFRNPLAPTLSGQHLISPTACPRLSRR